MSKPKNCLMRVFIFLATLSAGTTAGCLGLETVDFQKALSSGLQTAVNSVFSTALKAFANTLVGLPPNPV